MQHACSTDHPETILKFWRDNARRCGDGYVAFRLDYEGQRERVLKLVRPVVEDRHYGVGLDFGCGPGRFVPFLSELCDSLYVADLMPEMAEKAARQADNATAVGYSIPPKLELPDDSLDFLWTCFVLQHIVHPKVFKATCVELRRVLKPGAEVLLVESYGHTGGMTIGRPVAEYERALEFETLRALEQVQIDPRGQAHNIILGKVR